MHSEGVCTQCGKGWCPECVQRHGTANICPDCDALCTSTKEKEDAEKIERQRRRPLRDEIGTVLTYPLKDPMAYLMMAFVVGIFSAAAKIAMWGGTIAVIISTGLLYSYSFTAINRVADGNTTNFMPDISDISDLIKPVFLGIAAMIISRGPFLVLTFALGMSIFSMLPGFGPSEPTFEDTGGMPQSYRTMLQNEGLSPEEIDEIEAEWGQMSDGTGGFDMEMDSGPPSAGAIGTAVGAIIAIPFALLWWLLYAPIALIAAAISQSFFATLNPITGIDAIRRMGSIYWEAWIVYLAIAIVSGIVSSVLGFIPLIGPFLGAFVDAYAYLSFGCLLGFAVFKRARELGVD